VPVSGCGFDVFAASLTLTGNHAPITISDNVVRGVLACTDNDAAPTGSGNRLRGGATGQCAGLAGSAAAAAASSKAAGATAATDRAAGILAKIGSRHSTGERAAIATGRAVISH
jgi:hypothetical protein